MATRKYKAAGPEAEFEPGSRGRVLRNLLGITRVRDMNGAETEALVHAQRQALEHFSRDHGFTAADVRLLHRMWLDKIYPWAGEYRAVNIGKGGFQFAHAPLIPGLMAELQRGALAAHTPCRAANDATVARALAEVHAELVLIHPFREGNGRVARLLALLMGLQAGLPPLDFSALDGHGKAAYIAGIQTALDREYDSLAAVFRRVIDRTWKRHAASSGR